MKVPPKRKGNFHDLATQDAALEGLNESPSQKEGKCLAHPRASGLQLASMKVPPKRKGNALPLPEASAGFHCLNESPSQKEGKWGDLGAEKTRTPSLNESPSQKEGKLQQQLYDGRLHTDASMKVPPKRKGNPQAAQEDLHKPPQ